MPPKPRERKSNQTIIEANKRIKEIGNKPISELRDDDKLILIARTRIEDFHAVCEEYDIKPTIEGLALCLGVDRQLLTSWHMGEELWVKETHLDQVINQEWAFINACHVTGMEEGTIDKVVGIFVGKNNFGYKNEDQEVKPQEININFSAAQLIEEAKNLQIGTKK